MKREKHAQTRHGKTYKKELNFINVNMTLIFTEIRNKKICHFRVLFYFFQQHEFFFLLHILVEL